MSNNKHISPLEEFIKDKMENAEMQAPDIWNELSASIPQPKASGKLIHSSVFKGVVTALVVGGVAATLWLTNTDQTVTEPVQDKSIVTEVPVQADSRNQGESTLMGEKMGNDNGVGDVHQVETQTAILESNSGISNSHDMTPEKAVKPGGEYAAVSEELVKGSRTRDNRSGLQLTDEMYNQLLVIYISDTIVCKGDVCVISTGNMQLFDRFYWEVDGQKMNEGQYSITYQCSKSSKVMVKLLAEKDGKKYGTARYVKVVGGTAELKLYKLADKQVRGVVQHDDLTTADWHFGDNKGWNKGNSAQMDHTYDHFGKFQVKAAVSDKNGCHDTAKATIELNEKLSIVNVFTPWPKDGTNDTFDIKGNDITEFHLTVRNAAGKVVFTSDDIAHKWDGSDMADGSPVPGGTYIYQIVYRQGVGSLDTISGKVTVIY